MINIGFSFEEAKIIFQVFNNSKIQLGDAIVMLPIADKIQKYLLANAPKEDLPKEEVKNSLPGDKLKGKN